VIFVLFGVKKQGTAVDHASCECVQNDALFRLNPPPAPAIEALQRLLVKMLSDKVLDQNDLQRRRSVLQKLNRIISKELKGKFLIL